MDPLRIAVVSADGLARSGLAARLARAGMVLAAELAPQDATPGALAAAGADAAAWDLGHGEEAGDLLREAAGAVPVLALLPGAAHAAEALAAGARGAVLRDASPQRLGAALAAAAAGLVALDGALAPELLRAAPSEPGEPLTPRELEVLPLLAEGLSNKQIGARLGIAERTAKFHVESILAKLPAGTRAEAVAVAARRGLLAI